MTHDASDMLDLDIHPASPAEREAAYRNVHEIWGRGLPLDEHVRQRLESPKHRSATWFVGCRQRRVLTSLGAYPIELALDGQRLPAVAIGSVHTLPECRGQGLAPRLLTWVERHLASQGVVASLLYSDIDPQFYARFGYQQCSSWCGWHQFSANDAGPVPDIARRGERSAGPPSDHAAAGEPRLERFDPRAGLAQMSALYDRCHGRRPLSIARSESYWQQLYQRSPHDSFYWLIDADITLGYVRLSRVGDDLRIVDHAVDRPAASIRDHMLGPYDTLYGGLIELARQQRAARVGGWLPADDAARRWFRLAPRSKEITMVKSLDPNIRFHEGALEAAAYFCEIDHV